MKIYEGAIVACDRAGSVHRFLVEDKGRILHAGPELPAQYRGAPREALGARALLPAFGDTHLHFSSYALFSSALDVRRAGSLPELAGLVESYARRRGEDPVLAFGASAHSVKEGRLISRAELDAACPGRGVFLVKYDGHACVLSSALIARLPEKIKKLRGFDGVSGEIRHEAFYAVADHLSRKVSPLRTLRGFLRAVDALAARGVGLMHTAAGVDFPLDLDVGMEMFLNRGLASGFQTRVFFQTMDLDKVKSRGLPRVGGCFATALDGCFGSADAALLSPYADNPGNKGILYYTDEEVAAFAKRANREGLQIEMHAIGDAAFDQAVRAIEAALKDLPRQDHRHGIIHACLPTEDGLRKCAELGIQLPVQPAFLAWDLEPMSYLRGILGDRAGKLMPLRAMTDMGLMLSGGSDAPCTVPDPLLGIHAACNHPDPAQSLTIAEALKLFTYNAAWASFDEKARGSLEPGKIADMVVLNRDPLAMKPSELMELKVEGLILKGEPYRAGQGVLSYLAKGLLNQG